MSKRVALLYLEDINIACQRIIDYSKNLDFNGFSSDNKTIDAIVRNLSVIGEAANNLQKEVKSDFKEVPWIDIIGMRNKVIHEYFGVDKDILWQTVSNDIPILKKQILQIIKKSR